MMQEDFATNRAVAAEVAKILRTLDEHGRLLTIVIEQRASRDRAQP
jgi:hypothetical protein